MARRSSEMSSPLAIASPPDHGAKHLIDAAIEHWGTLDVVVNNAGILRDRMIFNMSVEDFDAVIRVHLRGTWCMCHHAAVHDLLSKAQPKVGPFGQPERTKVEAS